MIITINYTIKQNYNCIWYLNSLCKYTFNPIRRGFVPCFVHYKKGCTRLAAASDKAYQLLAHGRWFSPGTPASSTTKTGRHDIAEIFLKVALNTKNQSINHSFPWQMRSNPMKIISLIVTFLICCSLNKIWRKPGWPFK